MARTEVDQAKLRDLLALMTYMPPNIRRDTRRELRTVGDDVIAKQREILSGPLPKGVRKSGQAMVLRPGRGGSFRLIKQNTYEDADVKNGGRSSGMREGIKAGLRTRILTGARTLGIDIKTTGPRAGKFNQAKFWNGPRFRHPVFGNKNTYVYQSGQGFFFGPARAGYDDMAKRAEDILERNLKGR